MYSEMRFAIVTTNRDSEREKTTYPERNVHTEIAKTVSREDKAMKGSITFKFSGDVDNYCVSTLRDGDLDSRDLDAIVALLDEEIRLKRLIAWGEITPTLADPTGTEQLHRRWSN
jgi:hypothetical protein